MSAFTRAAEDQRWEREKRATRRDRPFVPWIDMESTCGCLRRRCRHRRRVEADNAARRVEHERLAALTDDDVAWLREMGWQR